MVHVELLAAVVSALAVWLTALRRLSSWPVGLASVILYAWVFVDARLYSDALLQGIFGVMIMYGWAHWAKRLDDGGQVCVAALSMEFASFDVALGAIGAVVLGYVMHRWTNAALPWLDATLTCFSLVAQWWQARRHIAAWWLWILVDVVYVGEYVYKDLRITAALYAGFVVLAVFGLRKWQRTQEPCACPSSSRDR